MKYINKYPEKRGQYWCFDIDHPEPQCYWLDNCNGGWKLYGCGGYSQGVTFDPERTFRTEEPLPVPPIDFSDADYKAASEKNLAKWSAHWARVEAEKLAREAMEERDSIPRLEAELQRLKEKFPQ